MPALPAAVKVVRVDFHMQETDSPNMMIHLFAQYGGTLSSGDATTWCAAFRSNFITDVMAQMANQVTLFKTVLTDLSSNTAPQVIDTTTGTGALGTSATIAGLSVIIQFKIARRYRGGHPRIYLPGLRASDVSNLNQINPTQANNIKTAWQTFITAAMGACPAAASPASHVNVSYFHGFTNVTFPSGRVHAVPTPRGAPQIDAVSSYGINPVVGMQRRRIAQP